MKDIRIATATMHSVIHRTDQNLDTLHQFIKQAYKLDVKILCFPEMNLTGYCNKDDIVHLAQTIPNPLSNALMTFARTYNMTILAGLPEIFQGGIYITHLVASPERSLGIYRKLYLAPPEKKYFSQGKTVPVFQDHGLCLGIQLCYDVHFPELSTLMTRYGAEILFLPHASPHGTSEQKFISWMRHLPARAYDNSVFVVACNASGENCAGLKFPPLSLVIDPSGKLIKKSVAPAELMVVDLMAKDLDYVRMHHMRYFFPNQRQDILDCLGKQKF